MKNATKHVGNLIVHRHVVYGVYEASSYFGPHSSLLTIEGRTCGQVNSRRLPAKAAADRTKKGGAA